MRFTLLFASLTLTTLIMAQGFYDFKVQTLDGKPFAFSELKGKKVMIVNVASECGLTPQYVELQQVYTEYKDKGFTIIGFPANNFGAQEPGTHSEIAAFCQKNYGVDFLMAEKISVKGEDQHPIYQWLTQKSKNGVSDATVDWNFHKFLVDANGNWVKSVKPQTLPTDKDVISFIRSK